MFCLPFVHCELPSDSDSMVDEDGSILQAVGPIFLSFVYVCLNNIYLSSSMVAITDDNQTMMYY
jgi:hypothetical protein